MQGSGLAICGFGVTIQSISIDKNTGIYIEMPQEVIQTRNIASPDPASL